jgi:nucleotide-binding universal stress UspA family protein
VRVLETELYRPYPGPEYWEGWEAGLERSKRQDEAFLDERARSLRDEGVEVGDAHLALGDPDKEIVKFAEDAHADLIVLGSRGLGRLRRALLGSVSDSVVRHAHCPVLVVRQGPTHESLVRPSTQLG